MTTQSESFEGEDVDLLSLRSILSSAFGRGHFLNIAAEAEDSDQGQVFDSLLAIVGCPDLAPKILKHRDDEKRHAAMLRSCVIRNGVTPYPVPRELRLFALLSDAVGGFLDDLSGVEFPVMRAYLLLQVAEERAASQYGLIASILSDVDPESARVIRQLQADEICHLGYCRSISSRYAPSPGALSSMLAEFRAIESVVFPKFARLALR